MGNLRPYLARIRLQMARPVRIRQRYKEIFDGFAQTYLPSHERLWRRCHMHKQPGYRSER